MSIFVRNKFQINADNVRDVEGGREGVIAMSRAKLKIDIHHLPRRDPILLLLRTNMARRVHGPRNNFMQK